jgi:hypothetical protein
MNWLWFTVILLLSLGPVYLLGLTLYRLWLSAKAVQQELAVTATLLTDLTEARPVEVAAAVAATASDLDALVSQRVRLKQRKERRRSARQRRLIARLHKAEEKK